MNKPKWFKAINIIGMNMRGPMPISIKVPDENEVQCTKIMKRKTNEPWTGLTSRRERRRSDSCEVSGPYNGIIPITIKQKTANKVQIHFETNEFYPMMENMKKQWNQKRKEK